MKSCIFTTLATIVLSSTLTVSMACDIHGKSGFMPKNNLNISLFSADKSTNTMTKERFQAIISRVSNVYSPIVKEKGGNLVMNNLWDDGTVNALAERQADKWIVHMFGGLARHPLVTDDAFMMVVCHELGHHIGGAPRKNHGKDWAANEGQADYFGAMKCMRRILEKDDNQEIVSKINIDSDVIAKCQLIYKSADEIALCQRIAMAGKSLGNLLNEGSSGSRIAFNTPDKKIVSKTFDNHPEAQCRLDTYFSGILCDKSYEQDTDLNDPSVGGCIQRDGHKLGMRPLCWYRPSASEI